MRWKLTGPWRGEVGVRVRNDDSERESQHAYAGGSGESIEPNGNGNGNGKSRGESQAYGQHPSLPLPLSLPSSHHPHPPRSRLHTPSGRSDSIQSPAPSSSSSSSSSLPSSPSPSPPLSFIGPVPFPVIHPSGATFLSSLHATGHFLHLTNILAGVNHALTCMSQGICIVIHCSDGWDRTSLLTSLCQLALDAYYRTVEGFIVLIEKEWLSFGHRFADRLGHGHFSQEISPIMLQFLDCVYQYLTQFPSLFQFDSRLLCFIYHHLYSGLFGTFLFNSEEERMRNSIPQKTRSIWSYVVSHVEEFVQPLYGVGWNNVPTSASSSSSFLSTPLSMSFGDVGNRVGAGSSTCSGLEADGGTSTCAGTGTGAPRQSSSSFSYSNVR